MNLLCRRKSGRRPFDIFYVLSGTVVPAWRGLRAGGGLASVPGSPFLMMDASLIVSLSDRLFFVVRILFNIARFLTDGGTVASKIRWWWCWGVGGRMECR